MKNKFKYTDLMIAGTIGAIVALAIHHEWRKSRAKAFISSIQKETEQSDEACRRTLWDDLGPEDVVNMDHVFEQHQAASAESAEDSDSEEKAAEAAPKEMDPESDKEAN